MDRLGAIASFLLITLVVMLGLRGAHLLIGAVYPTALPGPFELASLDEIEQYTGFSPHIPFYRPMVLGSGPREVVAERRPRPRSHVVWQGEVRLELTEWGTGYRPPIGEDTKPLPEHPEALYWHAGDQLVAVVPVGDRWLEIRTDLDLGELRRIVETLLPYDRLI